MFEDLMKMIFDDDYYRYSRPIMERKPYAVRNYKDHALIMQNVAGISADDISVDIESDRNTPYLVIKGETKNKELNDTFSIHVRYSINKDMIDDVEWEVKDGFLYVNVNYKKPAKIDIPVKKIESF